MISKENPIFDLQCFSLNPVQGKKEEEEQEQVQEFTDEIKKRTITSFKIKETGSAKRFQQLTTSQQGN